MRMENEWTDEQVLGKGNERLDELGDRTDKGQTNYPISIPARTNSLAEK